MFTRMNGQIYPIERGNRYKKVDPAPVRVELEFEKLGVYTFRTQNGTQQSG